MCKKTPFASKPAQFLSQTFHHVCQALVKAFTAAAKAETKDKKMAAVMTGGAKANEVYNKELAASKTPCDYV